MKVYFFVLLTVFSCASQSAIAQKKDKPARIKQISNGYERGTIQSGYKSGIWEYYDKPGVLSLRVDYTTGQVVFMKKDTASHYAIEKSGVWSQSSLDVQPRYIGSTGEFYKILMRNIRYPGNARNSGTSGTVYVMFEVDTTGKADNFTIVKDIGDNCAEEVIKALKLIPNLWIAASKNNVTYKSRFILPVTFSFGSEEKPKSEDDVFKLPVSTILHEVKVIATIR